MALTLLSVKKQNTSQITVAMGLVCPLTWEGGTQGPAVSGPATPLLATPSCHSSSPVHLRCSQDILCVSQGWQWHSHSLSFSAWNLHLPAQTSRCASVCVCVKRVMFEQWNKSTVFCQNDVDGRYSIVSSTSAAETEGWRSYALSWQSWSPEPLPSRLEGVLGFIYCIVSFLKVKEKHGKSYFQPFSLAGFEGIWWSRSLVAFQINFWCVGRRQKEERTRDMSSPNPMGFMNQRFLKLFNRVKLLSTCPSDNNEEKILWFTCKAGVSCEISQQSSKEEEQKGGDGEAC